MFDAINIYTRGTIGVRKSENIKFPQKPIRVFLPKIPTTKLRNIFITNSIFNFPVVS
jgi:hypothetical protein